MDKACGGADQHRRYRPLPLWPPGTGDSAAGKPGSAAAKDSGHQDNVRDAFASIEIVHVRFPSVGAAFEIGGTNFGTPQQFAAGAGQRDLAVDHDVAAVRQLEGVIGVLLDEKHSQPVALV